MKRVEVSWDHSLKDKESVLVDNHSFLNVLNVLEQQLSALRRRIQHRSLLEYCDFCLDILIDLSSPDFPEKLPVIEERFGELCFLLKELMLKHPEETQAIEGILETLEIALSRTNEFGPDRYVWGRIPCESFHSSLASFLSATERVSRGRFHFVYAPSKAGSRDYEIDFKIEAGNSHFPCPPVLQDTLRDLVGNARKYSSPGSRITIRLSEIGGQEIRLSVADEGIGIPEDEVEKVVRYGYRASNVLDRKTMGGGFGLTKAYLLCKRFKGTFHIETKEGEGTTVELTLFRPT